MIESRTALLVAAVFDLVFVRTLLLVFDFFFLFVWLVLVFFGGW